MKRCTEEVSTILWKRKNLTLPNVKGRKRYRVYVHYNISFYYNIDSHCAS